MKTKSEIELDIRNITKKIQSAYPELSKYIKVMPVKSPTKTTGIKKKNLEEYYLSLVVFLEKYSKTNNHKEIKFPDYPFYPTADDMYNKGKKQLNINPELLTKNKSLNEQVGTMNEKEFKDDMTGDDLDVPGAELDDQQESVGSEDEENNYYSIGGDAHDNLEEDNV